MTQTNNHDPRRSGHAIRTARAIRVRSIRRRVVGGAVAVFVAAWLLIAVVLVTGHDPALSKNASTVAAVSGSGSTGSSASGSTSAASGNSGTTTGSSGSGSTSSSGSGSTSSSGSGTSSVTTRQS
jgi:hypothetical protein